MNRLVKVDIVDLRELVEHHLQLTDYDGMPPSEKEVDEELNRIIIDDETL